MKNTVQKFTQNYKKFRKTKWFIPLGLIIFVALSCVSVLVVYSEIDTWATGYQLSPGQTKNVYFGPSGSGWQKVTNTSGNTYFVPTKTEAEWSSFDTHKPTGVSITGIDCTSVGTLGSGSAQFTVQPTAAHNAIKTGTCTSGYCNSVPTATCNNGTWVSTSNTCRASNFIWKAFSFPGGTGVCGTMPSCSGQSAGASCSTPWEGCLSFCQSGVGASGLKCVDSACQIDIGGNASCPTCSGGTLVCPTQNYTTGGSCGSISLNATANTTLSLTCPGNCIGSVSATCNSSGAWSGISNTCRQPYNCSSGTSGSGSSICTYPATTHTQTGIAGSCNVNGSCSVGCFDGTVSVVNNCSGTYCGDGTCQPASGETCANCSSDCGCGSGYTCYNSTCMSIDNYCTMVCAQGCAGNPACMQSCMPACLSSFQRCN